MFTIRQIAARLVLGTVVVLPLALGTNSVSAQTSAEIVQRNVKGLIFATADPRGNVRLRAAKRLAALGADAADAYNNRGYVYMNKGQLDKALADLNKAIGLDPSHVLAYGNRGFVYNEKGELDKALADYDEAIRLDPGSAVLHNNRGTVYSNMGELDRALAEFDEAIRLEPGYAIAHSNRGTVYSNMGDFNKALTAFDEAVRLDLRYAMFYCNRGEIYGLKNDLDKALADLSEAIRLDAKSGDPYYVRADLLRKKGELRKSVADYDEAIRLDPERATTYCGRAIARFQLGQTEEAIRDVSRAATMTPSMADRKKDLAWSLATNPHATLRRVDRAVELAQEAVEQAPQRGSFWTTLGVAQYRAGNWQSALEASEKSEALGKSFGLSPHMKTINRFFLAMTHSQLGSTELARDLYDQAIVSMDQQEIPDEELVRFRAEAAQLFEVADERADTDSLP